MARHLLNMLNRNEGLPRVKQTICDIFAFQARVALYKDSKHLISIIFNATESSNINWFAADHVLHSPWENLREDAHNHFSIIGGTRDSRRFYIQHSHGGCSHDEGWLVIPSGKNRNCNWENRFPRNTPMFSTSPTYTNWNNICKSILHRNIRKRWFYLGVERFLSRLKRLLLNRTSINCNF